MQEIRMEAACRRFSSAAERGSCFQNIDTEPRSLFRYHALEDDELSGKRVDSLRKARLVSAGSVFLDYALPNRLVDHAECLGQHRLSVGRFSAADGGSQLLQ